GLIIKDAGTVIGQQHLTIAAPAHHAPCVEQDPALWWQALIELLGKIAQDIDLSAIKALSIDGTSGTLLLTDQHGNPVTPALMYNDARAIVEAQQIAMVAPVNTSASGPSSALAKLLWLQQNKMDTTAQYALHQADWLSNQLTGRYGYSDVNNCSKLGFDAIQNCWPTWLDKLALKRSLLPTVTPPGTNLGTISASMSTQLGLHPHCQIFSGTTDSTAAIIASGANLPGDAITSLGSTLVTKIISAEAIFEPHFGIYSQPYGDYWLVGGSSNSGGAVLRQFFQPSQLEDMTSKLDFSQPTGLNYYPLPSPGERFPYADITMQPKLEPRPSDDVCFFQAILEGLTNIEHQAYDLLQSLGAPRLERLFTLGGGTQNKPWMDYRAEQLSATMVEPLHEQAAYGTALLARKGLTGT
ncbi:MAG: FGGY-family carbohydrate kinase, partial [Gammaproteobacteria bacterium]|nr:FGGY-family carbohydrate kinase [Gammaproteobacteria bacterium]